MKIFDWCIFLAANGPSKEPMASPLQQKRQRLIDERLVPELYLWSKQYNMVTLWRGDVQTFQKRLQYSAFASVCKTYDPSNDTQVWLAARFSLWVWAIDHYIDNELLPFLRNQDCSIEQKIAYLDEQLAILTEPLCSSGLLTYQEAQVSHLKPKHSVTPTPTAWEVPRFPPALDHVTLTDEMVTQHAFYIKEAFIR